MRPTRLGRTPQTASKRLMRQDEAPHTASQPMGWRRFEASWRRTPLAAPLPRGVGVIGGHHRTTAANRRMPVLSRCCCENGKTAADRRKEPPQHRLFSLLGQALTLCGGSGPLRNRRRTAADQLAVEIASEVGARVVSPPARIATASGSPRNVSTSRGGSHRHFSLVKVSLRTQYRHLAIVG